MWWLWWPVLRQSSPRILCRDGRHWEILSRGLDMPGYVWILRGFASLLHQRSLEKGVETAFSQGVPNGRHLCPLMTCLDQRYWIKTCNWSCELLPGPRGRNSSPIMPVRCWSTSIGPRIWRRSAGPIPTPSWPWNLEVHVWNLAIQALYATRTLYTVYTTVCYCSIADGLNGGWYRSFPPQYHWYSLQSSKMAWAVHGSSSFCGKIFCAEEDNSCIWRGAIYLERMCADTSSNPCAWAKQVDTGWHRLTQVDTGWHRLTQVDTGWHRLTQVDTGWHRLTCTC